ncbi:MAG: tetratricopeptide repeat protein [Acidobacteria bacterium]|nr:tetratricopeptide repeat protein [Acidobacteriota bacterium]
MEAADQTRRIRFDAFDVNLRSGEVRKHGIKLKLHRQPFQVLSLLLEHPGEVVTREELRQRLWPGETFVDFDTGLNSAVKKLRDALCDSAEQPRYIETLPRRGYRFIAQVESGDLSTGVAPIEPLAVIPLRPNPIEEGIRAERPADGEVDVRQTGTWRARRWLVLGGAAALALIAITSVMLRGHTGHTTQPRIRSLAVLPLSNLSGDSTQEYLADEMTEELCGRLARIHDLRVISRTSVMRFKGTKLSVPEIAKTLGVDALVEGSVIRQGNQIRVHAQLIRASTDEHIWSDEYDGGLGDVLALESEVAQSIARRVEVKVTGEERARLVTAHHVSPEVYESYLKAEDQFGKSSSQAELVRSIDYFEETIGKDANFAPAYVGLAKAYERLGSVLGGAPPKETHPKMMSAARKAIELDPDLAEPHVLLAEVYQKQWQWSDAEAEFKRALELNSNDAGAHVGYAKWLLCQGRTDEALAWVQRARELDPLGGAGVTPLGAVAITNGFILFHARRYDEAIRELRNDDPDHWYLGLALIANGQPDEAITVLEKALGPNRNPAVMGVLVRAYAHAGRRKEALRLLDELKRRQQTSYVAAAPFVNAYLGLGDNEQALARLERAYQEQSNMLQLIKVHPYFDPLRGDPRFVDLVHRVGLDQTR